MVIKTLRSIAKEAAKIGYQSEAAAFDDNEYCDPTPEPEIKCCVMK